MEIFKGPMSLISPRENLDFKSCEFLGPTRPLLSKGLVRLYGSRGWQYNEDETGLAIIRNEVVIEPALEFTKMVWEHNLYALDVSIIGLSKIFFPLMCRMSSPAHSLSLDSKLMFSADEVEELELYRYKGDSDRWTYPSGGKRMVVFFPPDVGLLSKLTFSFYRGFDERIISPKVKLVLN